MTKNRHDLLRELPSIDRLVEAAAERLDVARPVIVRAARAVVATCRRAVVDGVIDVLPDLAGATIDQARLLDRAPLRPVINATGVILHTGLGRAPLAPSAVAALMEAGGHYAPVEIDLASAERGRRAEVVEPLLRAVTGAEAGTVTNNNASATMLAVAALAGGRDVVVSRGELVEIGGAFRMPDVIAAGGAQLREVGTTNKTRRQDYADVVTKDTGAILKVHPSNYRVQGFTAEVSIGDLVAIGRTHGVPVVHDVGSGALHDLSRVRGAPGAGLEEEPVVRDSIESGADVVLFSGDKLVGGPQAGIIVGTKACLERIERHPLMRAVRVDKLTLAALGATLLLHRDPDRAFAEVPVLRMLDEPLESVERRASVVAGALTEAGGLGGWEISVEPSQAFAGGGSLPEQAMSSAAVRLVPVDGGESAFARALRERDVLPRVADGAVWLDLRTVLEDETAALIEGVRAAAAG